MAAGLAPAAIGSDTGGSVRVPAALVGITGLKTTAGLISLEGVVPLAPTLDSIGLMTRTAADAALPIEALAGIEGRRMPSRPTLVGPPLASTRIVVLAPDQFPIAVTEEVLAAYRRAVALFEELGATMLDRRFPFDFADLMARNGELVSAEAWSQLGALARDPTAPLGDAVCARIVAGASVDAATYISSMAHHRRSAE